MSASRIEEALLETEGGEGRIVPNESELNDVIGLLVASQMLHADSPDTVSLTAVGLLRAEEMLATAEHPSPPGRV